MCKHRHSIVATAATHLLRQPVHLLGFQPRVGKHADLDHVRPWARALRIGKPLPAT